jgi:hypothetical protein
MGLVRVRAVLGQVFSEHFGLTCQFSFYQLLNVSHLRVWFGAGIMGFLRLKYQGALSQATLIIKNKVQHCVFLFFVFFFRPLGVIVIEFDDSRHSECPVPYVASQPDPGSVLTWVFQLIAGNLVPRLPPTWVDSSKQGCIPPVSRTVLKILIADQLIKKSAAVYGKGSRRFCTISRHWSLPETTGMESIRFL